MLIEHQGSRPRVHPSAYVAPTAVVCGDVRIGEGSRILFGAALIADGDEVFLATGATVFSGATVRRRAEVRINGVVHVRTAVPEGATVPIGWVAVGDPAEILPPNEHDRIWAIQRELNFSREVWGLERAAPGETIMPEMTERYARALGRHADDRVLG